MTGVGGRPEVVIEGSNNMNSGWKEYEFLYKPGNTSRGLPIVGERAEIFQLWTSYDINRKCLPYFLLCVLFFLLFQHLTSLDWTGRCGLLR